MQAWDGKNGVTTVGAFQQLKLGAAGALHNLSGLYSAFLNPRQDQTAAGSCGDPFGKVVTPVKNQRSLRP